MIQNVEIRNFQSLHHVSLDLAPLTVIVGPSSSGKSAFTRAFRTVTSNRRGAEFISHGERQCAISVRTERGTVTLTRGKGTADNSYVVVPHDNPEQQRTFTKLGGETPEEVSRFLGIDSRDPINYAGQFDKPYLLDDSSGEVARTLGSLTNVNVIFEGARESNRQKLAHAATLRTRADDLESIKQKIPTYKAVKQQDEALTRAEELISRAQQLARDIARLTDAIEQHEILTQAIERLHTLASRNIPSEQPILDAAADLGAFRKAIAAVQSAASGRAQALAAYEAAESAQRELEAEYTEALGNISDTLHGWIAATADVKTLGDGQQFLLLDEAVRVFTLYLETKATA